MKNVLLSLLTVALTTCAVFAEGSVSLVDLRPLIDANPALSKTLSTFELEPTGSASRLGKNYGNLSASRVGPYSFEARLKNDPGQAATLRVTLQTALIFTDASGKPFDANAFTPSTTGMAFRESLTRLEIESLTFSGPLAWQQVDLPLQDEENGRLRRAYAGTAVKKIELFYSQGDHDAQFFKVDFDAQGRPSKVALTASTWRFVEGGGGKTSEEVLNRTLEFQNETLTKASEDQGPKSQSIPLTVTKLAADRVYRVAEQMRLANPDQQIELISEMIVADIRLLEGSISLDDKDWAAMTPRQERALVPVTADLEKDALAMMKVLGLILTSNEEQPDDIWVDILKKSGPQSTVMVTLSGLRDDQIEAERYKLKLNTTANGRQLISLHRLFKKWNSEKWIK